MGARLGTAWRRVLVIAGLAVLAALVVISVGVQIEAGYHAEALGGRGPERALVLYHPSRDARFADDLSLAVGEALRDAGFAVTRATTTRDTPARPVGYALVAIVSNTYYWTPDLPTRRYLRRARLDGMPVIGLIGGAGATGRSERLLAEAVRATGARVIGTRSFWLLRPNDEGRMGEPNRGVAIDLARRFGAEAARSVLAASR